jgi:hypothetical protein
MALSEIETKRIDNNVAASSLNGGFIRLASFRNAGGQDHALKRVL